MTLSWVIVAFHRPDALRRLLPAVIPSDFEVIVVNVEDDPTIAAIASERADAVPTPTNVGYAAAVNAGAARATSDVVIFSNDDLLVTVDDLRALADAVQTGQCDVALPALINADGGREPAILALPTPVAILKEWALLPDQPVPLIGRGLRVEKWRRPVAPEPVQAGTAALVAVRTELLQAIPMPESYFLYWEELEWFWRLRDQEVAVQFRPEVVVTTIGGRTDVRPEKARLLVRNAVRCVRRTQSRRAAVVTLPIVMLWQLRLLLQAAVRRSGRQSMTSRLAGCAAAVGAWREAW